MTHFPKKSFRFAFGPPALVPVRSGATRDVIWGRRIFSAPALDPRRELEPLPFIAARVTQPSGHRAE